MESESIIDKASDFVFKEFKEKLPNNYTYHSYSHVTETVDSAIEIGKGVGLSEDDLEIVILSAWFHDIGYVFGRDEHEENGCKIAAEFLTQNNYPADKIEKIQGCIMATKMPQNPSNLLEEVLCDADMSGLASENHFQKSALLRTELLNLENKEFSDEEWYENDVSFLIEHVYKTFYAQKTLHMQKVQNVLDLQKKLDKLRKKSEKKSEKKKQQKAKLKLEKQKLEFKESKDQRPDRGIETMFRVTLRNHINLSAIADNKANIMLSINAIIISIVMTSMMPKIGKFPYLTYPMLVLTLTCVITIIFATLSTRPKITSGRFTKEDITNKTANLLFFGNFYNMSLEDFNYGVREMMNDKQFLYDSLTKDFYFLGQVLGKKYRYLSICYLVFLVGIIISVLSFIAAILFHYSMI